MKASSKFTIAKWDENPYQIISDNKKLTKAAVNFKIQGDIEGLAAAEWLMFYKNFDAKNPMIGAAIYVGLIRIEAKLIGKSGSFVLEDKGFFEAGVAKSTLEICPDSGTGELAGISGRGHLIATHNDCTLELEYLI